MRQLLPLLFVGFILTVMIFIYLDHQDLQESQQWLDFLKEEFPDYFNSSDYQMDNVPMECVHPKLDLFDRTMIQYFRFLSPIKCSDEPNWIYTSNGHFYIKSNIMKNHKNVQCSVTFFKCEDDHNIQEIQKFDNFSNGSKLIGDLFKVDCVSADGKKYNNIHAAIKFKSNIKERINKYNLQMNSIHQHRPHFLGKGLNVFILGIHSLSRMTFMRKLPRTYKYITNNMKGIILKGYNTIGEKTSQAFIPIFTGETEQKFSETYGFAKKNKDVESYPFIWDTFKEQGYVVAYGSDMSMYKTFGYSLNKGFQQPFDHFLNPLFIEAKLNKIDDCFGDTPYHQILLNYFEEFWLTYHNYSKFSFAFLSKYSHSHSDINKVGVADKQIKSFLEFMHKKGHFNKTVLIVMSDNGYRGSDEKATQQRKQEERMPMFAFVFPSWYEHLHPHSLRNFHINSNRLISPFDIYATLKDMTVYDNKNSHLLSKSINLFYEIPTNRTCEIAGIEAPWCVCLVKETVHVNDINVQKSAKALVNFINSLAKKHSDKCTDLTVHNVTNVIKYVPSESLLKFKKMTTKNKNDIEISDFTRVFIQMYYLTVRTKPNGSLFEAWPVLHDIRTDYFTIRAPDIRRLDKYSPSCINGYHEILSQYCEC